MGVKLDRVFVDASFLVATYNRRDYFHRIALEFDVSLLSAREIWTTDAVLLEVTATLSQPSHRAAAIQVWRQFHGGSERCRAVEASTETLAEAMEIYRSRGDKAWSLTDCLSFIVMEREGLNEALTSDQHFQQAGYRALLLE
ncbi:tRNA(fMet)-specific endonuclease VapC [Lacipirellula limnantheis]|uniref:tRNA(fMet)-specific endonuclease VapC n=2 Tax=Lacipirellula limnantheis TaxID=2528024 RepID=A0A517TRW2_9BACT|nr:tRNA(fMet)-specific endonuclease VapC [Lacipirellula limnantheis]